jgi:hypothetical protein
MMDIKGDFSGKGRYWKIFITERHAKINIPYKVSKFCWASHSEQGGVRLRATVSEFGPVLFSRILDLNDTQGGCCLYYFKYCDDNKMPLLDLKDFKSN